jgi:hypothetical protein
MMRLRVQSEEKYLSFHDGKLGRFSGRFRRKSSQQGENRRKQSFGVIVR